MILSGKTEVASPERLSGHNQSRFRTLEYDRTSAPDSIFYSELHRYVVIGVVLLSSFHNYIITYECCCLLLLTFSVLVINPKKLLHTVVNFPRGLLNREQNKNKKSGSASPILPHAARSETIN